MEQLKRLFEMFKKLVINKFFGVVSVHFNAGKITHLKKEENIKI